MKQLFLSVNRCVVLKIILDPISGVPTLKTLGPDRGVVPEIVQGSTSAYDLNSWIRDSGTVAKTRLEAPVPGKHP